MQCSKMQQICSEGLKAWQLTASAWQRGGEPALEAA